MPRRTTTLSAACATALAAFALSGCGGSTAPSAPAAPASTSSAATSSTPSTSSASSSTSAAPSTTSSTTAASAAITIKDFMFMVPASVPAGATIIITNNDTEAHTVTSKDGGFDVKVDGRGGTAMLTAPTKPGSYNLTCDYHSNMKGTLVVS